MGLTLTIGTDKDDRKKDSEKQAIRYCKVSRWSHWTLMPLSCPTITSVHSDAFNTNGTGDI